MARLIDEDLARRILGKKATTIALLAFALTVSSVSLYLSDSPHFFFSEASLNFHIADLYKISIFSKGSSPYVVEPWAASYPPFYFELWSVPYLIIEGVESQPNFELVYFGFQLISILMLASCSYLIYRCVANLEGNKNESLSLASIFFVSSLTAIVALVGDAFGLLFLTSGCLLFIFSKNKQANGSFKSSKKSKLENLELLGFLCVSLAVAFKVHPVIGALLILAYYLRTLKKSKFLDSLLIFSVSIAALDFVPALFLSGSFSSIVGYHAVNLQLYTFNIYAGLLGVLSNFLPSSSFASTRFYLDTSWLIASSAVTISLFFLCFKGRGNFFSKASPIELLSLGVLVWLLLLKQTLPHYFLWALVPLLASRKIKSSLYLISGEGAGLLMFSLGFLTSPTQIVYYQVPALSSAIFFLLGGILFSFFDFLAISSLIGKEDKKKEKIERRSFEDDLKIPIELKDI